MSFHKVLFPWLLIPTIMSLHPLPSIRPREDPTETPSESPIANPNDLLANQLQPATLMIDVPLSSGYSSTMPSDSQSYVPSASPIGSPKPSQHPTRIQSDSPSELPSDDPFYSRYTPGEVSLPILVDFGGNPSHDLFPLGLCQGDCDSDDHCQPGLYCYQRGEYEAVPGCANGHLSSALSDFCVRTLPKSLTSISDPVLPLGWCEGNCNSNRDCQSGLYCYYRTKNETVPGCPDGEVDVTTTNFCTIPPPGLLVSYGNPSPEQLPLGLCQGNCTTDYDCSPGLVCMQRNGHDEVPGCLNGKSFPKQTNFCIQASYSQKLALMNYGSTPSSHNFPLKECEGDCDVDGDCRKGLYCFQRNEYEAVPGCRGGEVDPSMSDYCVVGERQPVEQPVDQPLPRPPEGSVTYQPGNLTTRKGNLLLSEGLDSRLLASSGYPVTFHDLRVSSIPFHGRPDGGATFPDLRPNNVGGWAYVSNSEMFSPGQGGVGSLTFDASGNLIDYKMVLKNTTWNCSGGRTPWNTWVSCEEHSSGRIYQVDPFGERSGETMTLGNEGGRWESFAYDIRDTEMPRFYATEDHLSGALARFTPMNPNWNSSWEMLHGVGVTDYLMLHPSADGQNNGTFSWTENRALAKINAQAFYPFSEGIDVFDDQLFFVCKTTSQLYLLYLDDGTYTRTSTAGGLFDGKPDQVRRILGDASGLLYFTEEGNRNAGVHARDPDGRFYTIMESPVYQGETAGLAFSPDGMYLYVAYQSVGKLYVLWRRDRLPFQGLKLDVNYHHT